MFPTEGVLGAIFCKEVLALSNLI